MALLPGILLLIDAPFDRLRSRPLARQLERQEQGLCISCGYDLRGTPTRRPECGHRVTPMSRVYLQLLQRRRGQSAGWNKRSR